MNCRRIADKTSHIDRQSSKLRETVRVDLSHLVIQSASCPAEFVKDNHDDGNWILDRKTASIDIADTESSETNGIAKETKLGKIKSPTDANVNHDQNHFAARS